MERKYIRALVTVRDAVAKYKPQIERHTGVPLGVVAVDNLADWKKGIYDRRKAEQWNKVFEAEGTKNKMRAAANYVMPAARETGMLMKTEGQRIYVNLDEAQNIRPSDIVHELAYVLWNVIESPKRLVLPKREIAWREGFAAYGEHVRFRDIHGVEPRDHHASGMDLVNRAIEKYGQDIFLRIPKEWKDLDKKFK